jgi:hypothetical protein
VQVRRWLLTEGHNAIENMIKEMKNG